MHTTVLVLLNPGVMRRRQKKANTHVDVELCKVRHVPNSSLLPGQSAHRRSSEALANSTSHKTQTLDVLRYFRERCKQKGDIG